MAGARLVGRVTADGIIVCCFINDVRIQPALCYLYLMLSSKYTA